MHLHKYLLMVDTIYGCIGWESVCVCLCGGSKESGTEFIYLLSVKESVIMNHQCGAVMVSDVGYMHM